MINDTDILGGSSPAFAIAVTTDNFDDLVAAANKPRIPEGQQLGTVTDFKPTFTQKDNKPMFEWTFTIAEGDGIGKTIKNWTVLNSPALLPLLKALGITPAETPHLFTANGLVVTREDVLNRQALLDVKWEKRLKEESATIPADELTDDDYYFNAKVFRVYRPKQSAI